MRLLPKGSSSLGRFGRPTPDSSEEAIDQEQNDEPEADRQPDDDQPNAQRSETLTEFDQGCGGVVDRAVDIPTARCARGRGTRGRLELHRQRAESRLVAQLVALGL